MIVIKLFYYNGRFKSLLLIQKSSGDAEKFGTMAMWINHNLAFIVHFLVELQIFEKENALIIFSLHPSPSNILYGEHWESTYHISTSLVKTHSMFLGSASFEIQYSIKFKKYFQRGELDFHNFNHSNLNQATFLPEASSPAFLREMVRASSSQSFLESHHLHRYSALEVISREKIETTN